MLKRFLKSEYILIAVLLALGLATRLFMLSHPNQVVFDEVHFGKFVNAYFTGAYYFDIHPPLGKLLLALGARMGGYGAYVAAHGAFAFETIGQVYAARLPAQTGVRYVWFRLFPALAGGLLPLVAYWLMRELNLKKWIAAGVGLSLVFENALVVQSRFALLDSFLLVFGFAGLALFFACRKREYAWQWFIASAACLALSFSIKWTGLAFFGLAGAVWLFDAIRSRKQKGLAMRIVRGVVCFVLVSFAVYAIPFAIHFTLLPRAGSGDAYMAANFQSMNIAQKFFHLNEKMFFYNETLKAEHPYGSPAWTWPLMVRPVYYWVQNQGNAVAERIYLLGNPMVWYAGFVGLIGGIFALWRKCMNSEKKFAYAVLFGGYAMNFVPFISVSRVLFLYHYLAAMIFSVMLFVMGLDEICVSRLPRVLVPIVFIIFVVAGFAFFAPLSYGLPMSNGAYYLRTWLGSWI